MIKTAVILAAGLGSRMASRTKDLPKGLLVVDEKAIIEHSICKLIAAGIDKIVIGTGYMRKKYEELALNYPQIQCVYNDKYHTTGSMYTLYQLKDYISGDFLLLESDLLYEKIVLDSLLQSDRPDVILASELTDSSDEVFIETDSHHNLVNMSKKKEDLGNIYAELVGITKLSLPTFQKMCAFSDNQFRSRLDIDYEYSLVETSKKVNIFVHKLHDITWCEVDDEDHWNRAVNVIYPLIKARKSVPKPIIRNVLLNPGPATTTDTVKYAQIVPDICPREKEFGEVMEFISEELTMLVADPDDYTTVLFGGSGTAAVESILSSAMDQGTVVIINNGAYGKRMCQIASAYRLGYLEFNSPADEAVDLGFLEKVFQNDSQNISHLAMVHCETTTGLLNDIHSVGQLCKRYGIQLIVDAISSFGAIPIDMKKMNISYLAASSNKNLQGMAGVSFVIANKKLIQKTKNIPPRNLYLNLHSQYEHFERTKQMRFTPPVQTLYALKQAIIETKREGIRRRYERYAKSWETLIQGITRMGLKHLVSPNYHSKIITSIIEPVHPRYNFIEMHDHFYKQGFTIYPGKVDNLNTFRVANIGAIDYEDIEQFIFLLEEYLQRLTVKEGET
jgi:2-aminoethylphosphonate-pyruvate transaminase